MKEDARVENDPFLNFIRKYWLIFLFAGASIFTYATLTSQVSSNTNRIDVLEKQVQTNNATFLQIETDIASIKTTLEFIKQRVTQ